MAFDVKKMFHRELNVGLKDQQLRYWAGGAALLISVFLANIFLLILGILLVTSARLRWCPVYSALGKSTAEECGKAKVQEESAAKPAEPAPQEEASGASETGTPKEPASSEEASETLAQEAEKTPESEKAAAKRSRTKRAQRH